MKTIITIFLSAFCVLSATAQWTTSGSAIYYNSGNVGIATSSPQSKLDVAGDIQISNAWIPMGLMTEVGGPTPLLNLSLNFREPNRNNALRGAAFRIDSRGGSPLFQWLTRSAGSSTENIPMVLTEEGNVGIGTTSPNQKLTVNGTIYGKEVKVDLSVPGPDYVFGKDYKLASLEDIKNYIDENKHLPEVPSAKEMEKNGVQLGEMNMLLLKKIEELTLYVIEQNNKINSQNELILKQCDRISKLEDDKLK